MNTLNDFLIGYDGHSIAAMLPVQCITRDQAFRTAAWLVAMGEILPASEDEPSFDEVLAAIRNT